MCDEFSASFEYFRYALSYDVAILGVSLFLVISGYLIPISLEHSPNLLQFYGRKLIRIVVPFTVSYFLMTAALIVPALLGAPFAEQIPLFHVLRDGKGFFSLILGMFPVDLNVVKFFGEIVYWFVGEWFMGMLLWLYLISPPLYFAAKKFPLASLIGSIVVAAVIWRLSLPLEAQNLIENAWTLFVVRIPEFLFGMILFVHRERLKKFRLPLIILFATIVAAYAAHFVAIFPPNHSILFFATNPSRFFVVLPIIFLLFIVAEILNAVLPKFFAKFNALNEISYHAMIIQHVIINIFASIVAFELLGTFAALIVLFLITAITFKLSTLIKKFSDTFERFLARSDSF